METDNSGRSHIRALLAGLLLTICFGATLPQAASAATAYAINRQVDAALAALYAGNPAAVELSRTAKAILVFPSVTKAGFIFGGEFGVGALREGSQTVGYYSVAAASYGLQIGIQDFGYALFLMDDNSLSFLNSQGGWQLGVGPSIVVMDQGMARSLTTATELQGVYAFIFDQQGLMAGMGLQGSKITPYTPDY
jgi:lipid-binding SYLF domain-containing protein